jgi:hypothetical protein
MEAKYRRVAERFRQYAALCREFAEKFPDSRAEQIKRAERFERDARMIESDGKLIEETKAFLRSVKIPSAPISDVGCPIVGKEEPDAPRAE